MDTETFDHNQDSDAPKKCFDEKPISSLDATSLQHVEIDGIFHFLGSYGKFQMTQVFLMSVIYLALSIPVLHGVFVGKFVNFHCAESGTSFNGSTLPANQSLTLFECHVDVKDDPTSDVLDKETCDEYVYEGGDTFVSYIAEWDLVCGREVLGQLPQILLVVGQAFGASLIPHLGDRFGRRIVVIVSMIGMFVAMFFAAFVQHFELFLVIRFLIGAFNQGAGVPIGAMILEVIPKQLRALMSLLLCASWVSAIFLIGLLGSLLRDADWRMLQLAYALTGGIPSIICLFFLEESLYWLIGNSRLEETTTFLRKACRWNNKDYDTLMEMVVVSNLEKDTPEWQPVLNNEKVCKKAAQEGNYRPTDVIKHKNTRKITFVMMYIWMVTSLTFYAIVLMSTSLAGDPYVNFFLTAVVEFVTGIATYFIIKHWDRKPTLIGFSLASAAALLITVLVAHVSSSQNVIGTVQTSFTLIGQFFVSSIFVIIWMYTPELYPTNLRNIGIGIASAAARVGSSFSPLFTILARKIPWAPGALFGGLCLIGAFLLTMLPETRRTPLPVTLQDVDDMFKKTGKRTAVPLDDEAKHVEVKA